MINKSLLRKCPLFIYQINLSFTVQAVPVLPVVSDPNPTNGATVTAGASGQLIRVRAVGATSGIIHYDDESVISFSETGTINGDYLEATIPYTPGQMSGDGTNYWYVEATNASGSTRYPSSGNLSFTVQAVPALPVVSDPNPTNGATVTAGASDQLIRVRAVGATSGIIHYDDDSTISFSETGTINGNYLEATIPYTQGTMTDSGTNYWYVTATNTAGTTRYPSSGNLSFTVQSIPDPPVVSDSPQTVSTGLHHSLAIKPDGTLWAWGRNNFGQIGDNSTIDRYNPIKIGSDTNWVTVLAGFYHSFAVKSDGTLWAWGNNAYGQLGDNTTIDRHVPIQIGSDTNWMTVSTGSFHSLAIKSDSTLWAWGDNTYGQLGDGSITERYIPTQIGSDTSWRTISAGRYFNLAVKSNSSLWAWGDNTYGQLGDNSIINRHSPIQIGSDINWMTVSAGHYHSLAVKSDNTLWTWGNNAYGQLGDNSTTDRHSPVLLVFGVEAMPWLHLLLLD